MKKEFFQDSEYRSLVEPYQEEALSELQNFLRINSIFDESTSTAASPFGKGVTDALDYVAKLGERLGFKVDRCENYCTELSYGEGELLDIYAHADVVPVSKNWQHPPFEPTIEGDQLFARGATDDKGPGIAALYAAKALLDAKRLGGYKLRIIFGGNEERGSKCLEHYFQKLKKDYPTYGFTPDADFPLIFAEKGIYGVRLYYKIEAAAGLPTFAFGEATNVVLGEAKIKLSDPSAEIEQALADYRSRYKDIVISYHDGEINFLGRSVHGSVPWEGVNAGLHLLNFLGRLRRIPLLCNIFEWFEKGDGKNFRGDYHSTYFAASSYCIGKIKYDGKLLSLDVNMRLPENTTSQTAIQNLCSMTGAMVEDCGGSEALIVKPDSPLVKTLLKVYQQETGDMKAAPLAIGGGTYARESKNSVAFGPTFSGRDYRIHQDDEFINISDFNNLIGIYAHAIDALGALIKK